MKKMNFLKKLGTIILIASFITATGIFASAQETADTDVFDVTLFGATGDDGTDDGIAIQNAFDACNKNGGGTVYFPSGTFCVSKTVFYYSNQKIIFEEGSVLKRIENEENVSETCGVVLCNWFEAEDTNSLTSAVACENVEIIGGIFDANGSIPATDPHAVCMINTCHASNVYINGCTFINNYTSHCIEINSSDNVYIENCVFSDYIGTADTMRYNEMIQIDKAVNSGFGLYFDDSHRSLIGYFSETKIDTESPDCKGCTNINISNCTFNCNEYCSAIGNHHSSEYSTVNSGITVSDCSFNGGSGSRGYITFDTHTTDIEIFRNTFSDGVYGVTAYRSNANVIIHDNSFVNCGAAYGGSYTAYANNIDGNIDSADENAPVTDKNESSDDNTSQDNSFFARIMKFFEALIEMLKSLFGM